MTNLYRKVVILAVSAFVISLAGCKKEEEYGSFTVTTSSLDFEWGQTKEVGYSARFIGTFNTPAVPTGWTCTRTGSAYVITAPTQESESAMSGTIEVAAVTTAGNTISRKITVAIKIAEPIDVRANSIIISEPGKRYKFNALRRGGETANSITGATGATRVWATSKTAVINVSLENGYLYFATGDSDILEEGNAVVAVTDKDGNALWSWHIWVTGYNPAADYDVMDGHRVMNRNLGALASSNASPEDAVRSYGLYYQWGRKDPFVGPIAWDSTTPDQLYNNSGTYTTHTYAVSSQETGTVEYATAHPNTFITGDENNSFDWLFGKHDNALWSPTSKTLYDPCPSGWRIAPPTIWAEVTSTGRASTDPAEFRVEGEYQYGWTFAVVPPHATEGVPPAPQRIFFPAAGRRSFSPSLTSSSSNFTNVINDSEGNGYPVGFYWSGTWPLSTSASSLAFRRDYINPAALYSDTAREQGAPAGGFPLRCVAE